MSVYAIAVFLHIVGALGLFAALALEWASLYNLRRVPTAGQAREWTKLLSALRFVGGPSTLTILVTGIYMTATRWGGQGWIGAGLAGLVLIAVVGGALGGRRSAAIARTVAGETGAISAGLRPQPAGRGRGAVPASYPRRDRALEGAPQRGRERLGVARLLVGTAVDEEPRGAGHAALDAAHDVLLHPRRVDMGVELAPHPLGVDPQLARIPHQVLVRERRLPLVQQIMHLPELPLRGGRFRDFRRVLGVRVLLAQGKVPEHEPHLGADPAQHLLQLRVGAAAKRALEIAVFHEGYGGIRRSQGVVARADQRSEQRQVSHPATRAAPDAPRRWRSTPRPRPMRRASSSRHGRRRLRTPQGDSSRADGEAGRAATVPRPDPLATDPVPS